jgi:hypothetical protein
MESTKAKKRVTQGCDYFQDGRRSKALASFCQANRMNDKSVAAYGIDEHPTKADAASPTQDSKCSPGMSEDRARQGQFHFQNCKSH